MNNLVYRTCNQKYKADINNTFTKVNSATFFIPNHFISFLSVNIIWNLEKSDLVKITKIKLSLEVFIIDKIEKISEYNLEKKY